MQKLRCNRTTSSWKLQERTSFVFFLHTLLSFYFIYLFLALLRFVAALELSLVVASGDFSSLRCMGFSLQWLLLLQSMGSRCTSFSSRSTRVQYLWHMGFVPLQHVGSSRIRDQTCVPCIGRWILIHCTTREALQERIFLLLVFSSF